MQYSSGLSSGEILEKATRVLTEEEKAQLEVEFVGKNGQRRKLEAWFSSLIPGCHAAYVSRTAAYGSPKIEEVFPV